MRIGVDIGGTKIEVIALGSNNKELVRKRILTPRENYSGTLNSVKELIETAEKQAKLIESTKKPASIGIGIPGTISLETGLVKNANSTWLIGHKLDQDLINILNRPVKIENDANCLAISETLDGAAVGYKTVFAVILGTGVGGALCINGALLTGRNSIAGEWGHNPLPWPATSEDGRELLGTTCYCGQRSCVETFLSGDGLKTSYAILSGRNIQETPSPIQINKLLLEGETFATLALKLYATRLAKSLSTVINLIDPEVIVLGGGLSNIDFLYQRVPALWSQWVFSDNVKTKLVKNLYGDSSGVRGAAYLWP